MQELGISNTFFNFFLKLNKDIYSLKNMHYNDSDPILLFDGVCTLCNGFIKEVIIRDTQGKIRYASLQSKAGQELLKKVKLTDFSLDTVVLIEADKVYTKSDVALRIFRYLDGGWPYLYHLSIIPKFIRDTIYDIIARNRYNWFGKRDTCMVPKPEWAERFL